jgi:hypothetical protein
MDEGDSLSVCQCVRCRVDKSQTPDLILSDIPYEGRIS